jgi:hypothetical protein
MFLIDVFAVNESTHQRRDAANLAGIVFETARANHGNRPETKAGIFAEIAPFYDQ